MAGLLERTEPPSYVGRRERLSVDVDVRRLESDLRRVVQGEIRFDDGSRALYATDASNYRQPPLGVVLPRTTDDVIAAVEICRAHSAPLLSRGGGRASPGSAATSPLY